MNILVKMLEFKRFFTGGTRRDAPGLGTSAQTSVGVSKWAPDPQSQLLRVQQEQIELLLKQVEFLQKQLDLLQVLPADSLPPDFSKIPLRKPFETWTSQRRRIEELRHKKAQELKQQSNA